VHDAAIGNPAFPNSTGLSCSNGAGKQNWLSMLAFLTNSLQSPGGHGRNAVRTEAPGPDGDESDRASREPQLASFASASARIRVPRPIASGVEYSSGLWLTPARQGMNSMEAGQRRDMNKES
jgi:hypothetical protein